MLREKFDLDTEKDDETIQPLRFCNACYLSTSKTRASVVWEAHVEWSCKTCTLGLKLKKGGRPPKKVFGGRKTLKTSGAMRTDTEQASSSNKQELLKEIQDLSSRPSVNRLVTFQENFEFIGEVKDDFKCAVCQEILGSPIETKCEHYFCAGCLSQVVSHSDSPVSCPVCKESVLPNELKQPARMVLRLLGELEVKCKLCNNKCHYEDSGNHVCPPALEVPPMPTQYCTLTPATPTSTCCPKTYPSLSSSNG